MLYHGSYCAVDTPNLEKCALYKDFGQGFYLTTSAEQARGFAKISAAKRFAKGNFIEKTAYVSSFKVRNVEELNVCSFENANIEWLHMVVAHRTHNNFMELKNKMSSFDVVAGKIANDNTNATIAAYMNGLYGALGSKSADEICISLLLPERLEDQFCFRTCRAIEKLEFIGVEKILLE